MMSLALTSPVYAELKLKIMKYLQKRLRFAPWHTISTIYSRDYAKWIVKNVNELLRENKSSRGCVIEIGCGLGELLGNIKWSYKVGYDVDAAVIKAAKLLSNGKFYVGSFENANVKNKNVEVLILTNFLHEIPPEQMKNNLDKLCCRLDIKYIVLDTVKGGEYSFFHDGSYLLDGAYKLIRRSDRFAAANGAWRWEELWQKI